MIHVLVVVPAAVGWLWTADYTMAQPGSLFGAEDRQSQGSRSELIPGDSTTYLGPIKPNAYGVGIHADATGRAL